VIDADVLAREAVEPGRPAWRDIVHAFGKKILQPDRALDRRTLGRMVFRNRAKLKKLNAIVHPRVARDPNRQTREISRKDPDAVIIYDAPVLIEAGAHTRMDKIIVVVADQATQIKRLCNRSHFSRAEAFRRIRSQLPLAQKVKLADYVIDGTLSFEQTKNEVQRIYAELKQLA
ncbi:MAG: dephospho-CoA kinase, partial [Nitrospiraceae bacterium]